MTINQLFINKPPLDVIMNMLKVLNINSLDSDVQFSYKTLDNTNFFIKSKPYLSEISTYYLPCKQRVYFKDINNKRLVTIMKQCLKLYGKKLVSTEKYSNGTKYVVYQIKPLKTPKKQKKNTNNIEYNKVTLNFD
jgi:hypothetical protein